MCPDLDASRYSLIGRRAVVEWSSICVHPPLGLGFHGVFPQWGNTCSDLLSGVLVRRQDEFNLNTAGWLGFFRVGPGPATGVDVATLFGSLLQ